jgi:transglutaminase-like putative cysteine protease
VEGGGVSAPAASARLTRIPRPRLAAPRVAAYTELALRLAAFFAACVFAMLHWAALFDPMPVRRALVAALIVTCFGAALALSGGLPRPVGLPLRIALFVLLGAFGLIAIGIRAKLLVPAGWGTLGDRLSGGLSVVGAVTHWPYSGPNTWLRLTALAAAPLMATIAAAYAFWPVRSRPAAAWFRFTGLVLLLVLYGVAAAARPFGHQGIRGVGVLAVVGAWLWLPRLRGRDALGALAALVVVGALALGLTSKFASSQPWVDYRHWQWTLHREKTVGFDWDHTYGPIRWPRKGTTLLLIKSKEAHYWRAQTLDRFNGTGWVVVPAGQENIRAGDVVQPNHPGWTETVSVTMRSLRSNLVVGPGTPIDSPEGDKEAVVLANGVYVASDALKSGDTYEFRGYVPDPTPKQMRAAGPPDPSLVEFTQLDVPEGASGINFRIKVPLRGVAGSGSADAADLVERSPYARAYALANRLAAGQPTTYDIVKRIGAYLEGDYNYSEHPSRARYPLEAFLFDEKSGYCQHFSGAAALMLRMLGIPTRVVSGFAPGTLDKKTHEYVVKDLDAHSWIEVWFEGIGWVPFDPTPALAPASSQSVALAAASAARGNAADKVSLDRLDRILGIRPEVAKGATAGGSAAEDDGTPWGPIALAAVAVTLLIAALVAFVRHRRRVRVRIAVSPSGDADVDRLVRLLARLGLRVEPQTTLFGLEQRLQRLGGPEAAAYARLLRERRFGGNGRAAPGRPERRRIRRLLAEAVEAGPITRLQLALPESPLAAVRGLKYTRLQRSR